jgi:hypothetical protein
MVDLLMVEPSRRIEVRLVAMLLDIRAIAQNQLAGGKLGEPSVDVFRGDLVARKDASLDLLRLVGKRSPIVGKIP